MRIIPREHYNHPGPLGPALDLSQVTGWDWHHTAGPLDQTPHFIADYGRRKFGRSSYNFLLSQEDAEGDVWEMQGLHRGAHNDTQNATRLGLVFVGYYHPDVDHHPSEQMLEAAAQLMAHGYEEWGVPIHAKGHRDPDIPSGDTDGTACPGDHLYDQIDGAVRRAKELTTMSSDHSPIDRKAHSLEAVPDWAPWQQYVEDGGTTVPSSGVWPVSRSDLAWYAYNGPLADRVKELEQRIAQLEDQLDNAGGTGGLSKAEADERYLRQDVEYGVQFL